MFPIFVIKFAGVSDLQGVKIPVFPLTLLVIVTTVLRYRAACDNVLCNELRLYMDHTYRFAAINAQRNSITKLKIVDNVSGVEEEDIYLTQKYDNHGNLKYYASNRARLPENPKVNNAGHPKNLKTEHDRLKTHTEKQKITDMHQKPYLILNYRQ